MTKTEAITSAGGGSYGREGNTTHDGNYDDGGGQKVVYVAELVVRTAEQGRKLIAGLGEYSIDGAERGAQRRANNTLMPYVIGNGLVPRLVEFKF